MSSDTRQSAAAWWRGARTNPIFYLFLIVAVAIGYFSGGSGGSDSQMTADIAGEAVPTQWTCSMHPQIQLPEAGQCPICFMDLIPVSRGGADDLGPRALTMSESAKKLARIVTTPVERRVVETTVHLVGKVDYDETRLAYIPALVPGELEHLFVDYTGIEVQKGDHMVVIDSPGLLAAQEELLQAIAAARSAEGSSLGTIRETATSTVRAAKEKLRRWGLADRQITEIEERGTASDEVTLYAPIGGVVVEMNALEGTYVHIGTPIYTIADLTHLWVQLEAYESDLAWLRYGQSVAFTSQALPGEEFTGTIVFIDPILDSKTRTVKVRVNVPNPKRKLRPGMFVKAKVVADIAAGGKVMDPVLAGMYICPMHPEVVKDHKGDCDICGMSLVSAESLGYAVAASDAVAPLIIPASAPLITGKRAVVYVELPGREEPTYEGRDVVLGPRAGDFYIVESGLAEGERVVVNGAFKIDSELQIRAAPSMMSPEGGGAPLHDHSGGAMTDLPNKMSPPMRHARQEGVPGAFKETLAPIFAAYFDLQRALADDEREAAISALGQLHTQFAAVDADMLTDSARMLWDDAYKRITDTKPKSTTADDWDGLRRRFRMIATVMIDVEYLFGHMDDEEHYVTFCPMAFDNSGAYWLADTDSISNPYFGHKMQRCGKVTDRIGQGR